MQFTMIDRMKELVDDIEQTLELPRHEQAKYLNQMYEDAVNILGEMEEAENKAAIEQQFEAHTASYIRKRPDLYASGQCLRPRERVKMAMDFARIDRSGKGSIIPYLRCVRAYVKALGGVKRD